MAIRVDTEENEVRALQAVGDWRDIRVLEIGSGDGRLTERLVALGARVQAIDSDAASIRKAMRRLPRQYAPRVRFAVGTADSLEHRARSFDRVIYSWAL